MDHITTHLDLLLSDLLTRKNLEENLSMIIRSLEPEIEFQSLGIFLRTKTGGNFRFKIGRNLSHNFDKNILFHPHDPLIQDLDKLKPLSVKEKQKYKFEHEFQHLLIFPLYNNRELLGFFFMDKSQADFSDQEFQIIHIHSSIISLIISLHEQRMSIEQYHLLDDLTGFLNHRAFLERGENLLSQMRRYKRQLTMCVLKIDNYENLLRTVGKENCDDLIRKMAEVLKQGLRDSDLLGVLYRDAVGILLPEIDAHTALIPILRLDGSLRQLPLLENNHLGWGLAEINRQITHIDELVSLAMDAAFESTRKLEDNIIIRGS
ncbi:MAG: diguanylate cyclase [Candidatus Cloacimonetes bacterium]|nr:diguanylate cyclase [Candidatus Cloacimonadota bacterium]